MSWLVHRGRSTAAGSSPRWRANARNVSPMRSLISFLIFVESHAGVSPYVVENKYLPRLNRGNLSRTARISPVNGTACGLAFPFFPFIRAAGMTQSLFARSISDQ